MDIDGTFLRCALFHVVPRQGGQGAMAHSLGALAGNAHVEGGVWGRKRLTIKIIKGTGSSLGVQFF